MKQHYKYYALYSLLLILILSGCSSAITAPSTRTIANISENKLDESIFPKEQIVDVKISLDQADFQAILDNPTAEQYYEASVNYNGHLLQNIGIRTKGNSSLSSVAGMSDSERYSFKLSFDEYVTQSIGGITKINLNNGYSDASYVREFLAYEIAEGMGIPTPKYSFVRVYINDELWGLYTAVEQMSTAFVEREFGSASGTLYKSNGGNGAELTALDSFSDYTGLDVKSGKANEQALLSMTDTLNNGASTSYSEVLDVDSALRFIAFNTVTANMDSYAGNFKHNYYMYEQNGLFTIIPWDLNMSFGGFGGEGILIDEPTGVSLASRPLIAKLIADDTYRERYHGIIEDMINDYFVDGKFESRVLELQTLISDDVQNDPTSFVTFDQFQQGIQSLIEFANTQTESIQKQLSGEIATAGDGSGSVKTGPGAGGMGGFMFGGGGRGNRGNGGMQMPRTNDGQNAEAGQMPNDVQIPNDEQMPNRDQLPDDGQMPDAEQQQGSNGVTSTGFQAGRTTGSAQATNVNLAQLSGATSNEQSVAVVQAQMPSRGNRQAVDGGQAQAPQGGFENGQMPNGQQGQMPDGMQPPSFEDGEMPQMPDGMEFPSFEDGEMPQMPDGMQPPSFEDGEMPQMPDGMQPPSFEDGEMPQMPDGMEFPNFGDGQFPQGGEGWGGPNGGGGFPMGNNNANAITVSEEDQQKHLTSTLISMGLLVLGCATVLLWRRKSL